MLVTNVTAAESTRIAGLVIDPFVSRMILDKVAARVAPLIIVVPPVVVVKFPERLVPLIFPLISILPVPAILYPLKVKLPPSYLRVQNRNNEFYWVNVSEYKTEYMIDLIEHYKRNSN